MSEHSREMIALRVRGLREDSGVSAADLAAALQISSEKYAAYESAAEDIPASELTEIAAKLKIDLGTLLTGVTPKMSAFAVTRAGKGPRVDRRKGYGYENLASSFKGSKFEPFIVNLPETPADAQIPQNIHPGQEFNFLLEGKMILKVQENEVALGPGDSVIFDATLPHGMKAIDGPVRFLAVITA